MKRCSKCGINYELSAEFFQRNKAAKDGFSNSCKPCSHKREREYRKNNKEKISLAKKKVLQ